MGSMHVLGKAVPPATVLLDGFEVLDACHRQTLAALERLAELMSHLDAEGADAQAREMAAEVVNFFATTVRQHHEDEEKHVFPALLKSADPNIVETVLSLQQDHGWLEEDWRELSPMLAGIAEGQTGVDLETLRRGAEIFIALSRDHMALEESVIYPEARAQTLPSERRAMGREMAARHRAQRHARPGE